MNNETTTTPEQASNPADGEPALNAGLGWQPINTAPMDISILIAYTKEGYEKQSVIKAYQCGQYDEEAGDQSDNVEYCEEDDTYYIPAGWYEVIENWEDWSSVFIHGIVTHWMPLPEAPNVKLTGSPLTEGEKNNETR